MAADINFFNPGKRSYTTNNVAINTTHYFTSSADNLATISGSNYFFNISQALGASNPILVSDFIKVVASDGNSELLVTGLNPFTTIVNKVSLAITGPYTQRTLAVNTPVQPSAISATFISFETLINNATLSLNSSITLQLSADNVTYFPFSSSVNGAVGPIGSMISAIIPVGYWYKWTEILSSGSTGIISNIFELPLHS